MICNVILCVGGSFIFRKMKVRGISRKSASQPQYKSSRPGLNRRSVQDLITNYQHLGIAPRQAQHSQEQADAVDGPAHVVQPVHQVGPQQVVAHPGQEVIMDIPDDDHSQPGVPDQPLRGGQQDITEWIDPTVPGADPGPPPEDTDGWNTIDTLGVWECGLCNFKTLEEVPPQFRQKWTRAFSSILGRILAAQTDKETERGLKWFLVAAQVFFREPKRGGKRGQSNGQIAARFDCILRGDWGSLLTQLQADKEAATSHQSTRKRKDNQENSALSAARLRGYVPMEWQTCQILQ